MDYLSIGNRLKQARERKGLSYDQIYEITRIQPSVLKKIEEGGEEVAPVLLRGFIRSYALSMSLNPEELFRELQEPSLKTQTEGEPASKEPSVKTGKKKRFTKPISSLAGLLCVLGLLWFWGIFPWEVREEGEVNGDRGSEEEMASDQEKEDLPLSKKIPDSLFDKQKNIQNPPSLFHTIKDSEFKEELLIQSINPLEIYFKLDQKSTVTRVLKPSVWFFIKAKESIYLRFDDKKGRVDIFYNGKQFPVGKNSFFERTFRSE